MRWMTNSQFFIQRSFLRYKFQEHTALQNLRKLSFILRESQYFNIIIII